ncbi:MAG: alanine--tRNA ligase [Ignavibacteriae bacterium HGW-Ignavibacteriae-1]|jgi:alanyl-tRNA synthetase|nr:MAG: alanine--tRNA ligase [Ignavibacteriae bacterium HGW-Ignavibacteriae-1]
MTSQEIRKSFLDFFKDKEHRIVQGSAVIPFGDPTLLFTNAGMNQFKDVFLGTGSREYTRAADTQKCIRVSGKHNDLEEVGVDTYHHTFFEMLGNWSFGDYYKQEAIQWAWELLTDVWKLPVERLHASVYRTDDEAYEIWKKYLPESRIHRFDEKDNFWEMGETGPCGPCSEIHYDRTPDLSGANLVNAGVPEVIEIWNLVFIQYNRKSTGELEPLTAKHVDTGMGFERICSVIQQKESNYDTDVFSPIISEIAKLSGKIYKQDLDDSDSIAMRVIADHLRTLSFAIADGALPGNEGRGYVLRRILRRGSRFARNLGFKEPIIYKLLPVLIDIMGDQFPELKQYEGTIHRVIKAEEESFLQTLERGLEKFDEILSKLDESEKIIPGEEAFLLYDSFGFPLDLTQLIARERGYSVDNAGFDESMKQQKERSRAARKSFSDELVLPQTDAISQFVGYEMLECESEVKFVNENLIVLAQTPFYTESGGQISDTGVLLIGGTEYQVNDMKKSGSTIFHICDRNIEAKVGDKVLARVDASRRIDIMRNHSATHLMHEALRVVLGDHVQQAGSLVAPGYLRFDFNHFEKVSAEQIHQIERIVNDKILEIVDINIEELDMEIAAQNSKIKMFFGDKYGDRVRVVTMDSKYSMELCGGTHVQNTSQIGLFKIISESSIAAGVRRIEAITGREVENYISSLNNKLEESKQKQDELLDKIKELNKEINIIKLNDTVNMIINDCKSIEIKDIKLFIYNLNNNNNNDLRTIAEKLRETYNKNSIAFIASINDDKVQLACTVSDDLVSKYNAGKLIGQAAKIVDGGGGGKPHLATAGGKDISKLDELLQSFPKIVEGSN